MIVRFLPFGRAGYCNCQWQLGVRRLGETANGTPAQEEKTVVLEACRFDGTSR